MAFFQVLPKETGIAERFGEGFGQAFGGTLQDQLGQFFQEKKETKELERLQEQLKSLSPDATIGDRLQAVMMARASPKTKEKFMELMKLQGATDFAKKFREGEDVSEADLIEGMALGYIDPGYAQAKIRQLGEIPKRDQTKKIAEAYGIPPDLVSNLDPNAAHKFAEANRKENLDTYKEITDQTSSAIKKQNDLARLRNFIRRGALDPVSAGNFATQMEKANHPILASIGRAFESGDSAAAQSLLKDFFAENIKGLPAKGVNIFVEGIMRDALPLMGRSKEANLAVVDVIEEGLKAAFIPSQVRQEILSEHGGSIPWNFNALYQQRLAQQVDEQLNKAIAKGRAVIDKYGGEEVAEDEFAIMIDPPGNRRKVPKSQEKEALAAPEFGEVIEKKSPLKRVSDKEKLKDIGQQVFKKGTAGALSGYGNLLDLIHAPTKERMTPGQEALTQAEFEAPESLLPFLQDDDILPRYSRLPSQKEAETFIEMLGGPGEAKTEAGRIAGRGAEFAGGALPFGAGSKLLQLLAAVGMGGQLTRELGGPEAVATGIELLPLAQAGVNIAKAARGPKVPVTKPSGMPVRKFESLKKQTPVFEATATKAKEAIEGDFRKLTEDLLKKTNKSYVALTENPEFKQQIGDLFGKVKQAASEFPEAVTTRGMVESLTKEIETIGKRGISLSDSEKVQRSLLKKYRKDIVNKKFTAEQLVDQYRKNNEQLSKLYPYGEKALENIGKRNALESYNRAIAEAIEDHFPNSEFSDLFKFTNKRWSEIKKIETIDKYLDALFGKKNINFKQAEKVFTDPKRAEQLKNAIGPQVFDDFKQINKDLLTQENALKLLNAKGIDVNKIGKYALSYMVKPKFAATQAAIDLGFKIYRHALYRPEYMREWSKALSRLRKGDVQQALVMIDRLHEKLTDNSDLPKATK